MSLFSQRGGSIISFIDCLMVVKEKAEPDSCRRSTMRGLKAIDQIQGMEDLTRCEEIYFIFTLSVVKQKPDFLVSW